MTDWIYIIEMKSQPTAIFIATREDKHSSGIQSRPFAMHAQPHSLTPSLLLLFFSTLLEP